MVRFLLGKDLDRGICAAPESSLGSQTTGPRGLLSWLESQLGLELPTVSFTARMVPYLNRLRERDSDECFYHESLARDEFCVAAALLQWRDTWFEAGWTGDGFDIDASPRLLELGTIEDLARDTVPAGLGQRVQRVLTALESTGITVSITLLDPPGVFPKVWQQLFEKLGATGATHELKPHCAGDSDLARLQRALVTDRAPGEKIKLNGDGSVVVLRDGSPQLSAAWVARFAHLQLAETGDVAVLAQDHGATLDDALTDAGFPQLGFSDASFWRPAFQVLPLALELIWRPLDPVVLLQFLTHPMGPIPRHVRGPLADVVSSQPGIGGNDWLAAVEQALDLAVKDSDPPAAERKRKEEAGKIDFWLNCERFDPAAGVDIGVLKNRVQRVSAWLSSACAAQEDEALASVYAAALGQSDEVLRTLDRLNDAGNNMLSRESVRRLVEAVRGTGTTRPGRPWQCAPAESQLLRATSTAAFLQPVNNVIWWGCDEEGLPKQYPWSASEQAAMVTAGIHLVPINTRLEWQAKSWLRPILAAGERLVLVLHDNAESHHPVFDEIVAVAEGWAGERVDRLMRDPSLLPSGATLPETRGIPKRSLPARTRWWQLPEGTELPRREAESFSSLEKFLYGPHQWVLNYQARIRPGALAELEDGSRLKGSLAHELFEDYFNAHPDIPAIDNGAAVDWAQRRVRELIEEQGAVLLTPGRQGEKEFFIGTAIRALTTLIEHLQSARVVSVDMEAGFEGHFGGGAMNGAIDLLATNAAGEKAVVDIKWGGLDYRRNSLVDSNYLQLAVYAQLARQGTGNWPMLGYYIIRDARLLLLDSDYFPEATVVRPENGETHLGLWQRVEKTWQWRREQIERGLIEVPVTDTEPDEKSSPGEIGLAMPDKFDHFDDYTALTGWSEDS